MCARPGCTPNADVPFEEFEPTRETAVDVRAVVAYQDGKLPAIFTADWTGVVLVGDLEEVLA